MLPHELPADRAEARQYASALVVHAQTDSSWVADVLDSSMAEARRRGWHDLRLALLHASIVYSWKNGVGSTSELIDELEQGADRIGSSALIAIAMTDRIRYLRSIRGQAPFELFAEARVRLKDNSGSAGDRFAGLLNLGLELDMIGLSAAADDALSDAEKVLDELCDPSRARAALAHNQAHRMLRIAAVRMIENEPAEAAALLEESDRFRARIASELPESWLNRLAVHRRTIQALVDDDDVPADEVAQLNARLDDVNQEQGRLLELVRPLDEQHDIPTSAQLDAMDHSEVAWFLRVRSLRRAGGQGTQLVDALEGFNRAMVSRFVLARSELEAGLAAMVDAQVLAREHGELAALVVTDPLTRLGNRRAWQAAIDRLDGSTTTVVLLDLDRFKRINDEHGHVVGDIVLQRFAAEIAASASGLDPEVIARVGGDEFGVVLSGDRVDDAERFVSRLCRRLCSAQWPSQLHRPPTLTTGIGVGDSIMAVVASADSHLYEAKRLDAVAARPEAARRS